MFCLHVYTYEREQYEISNNRKVKMILLPGGICLVRVKKFHSAKILWHELSKSASSQGFVVCVKWLLVSIWKVGEETFPRGVVVHER